MVPKGWNHPVDHRGNYVPLMKGPYSKAAAEWDEEAAAWDRGETLDYSTWPEKRTFKPRDKTESETYEEYAGPRPVQSEYMPEWHEGRATMLVMYEDTSEGTPISPAFETPEELARWLADNKASAFGGMTATYEQWLATCKAGWTCGMVVGGGRMMSGVEFEGSRSPQVSATENDNG
jgi:hypothetical protein